MRNRKGGVAGRVIGGILMVVAVVVVVMVIRYFASINNFLSKVTDGSKEVKGYSVMVLDDSGINDVKGLESKSAGLLKTDEKAGNAEQHLQNIVKIEPFFYDDLDTLMGVLNNKIVSAVVLETDRLNVLDEEAKDLTKDTKVIYTFDIELEAENREATNKQVTKEPFILYISGTDSRAGVHATARSDVNIVAVVNPVKGKILLVSIPRDMYVQLHGTTGIKDKLTHAGVYGIDMSRTTIEDFLGAKIDYTLKVSFDTVVKVVDQIGGITIDSDTAMTLGVEGQSKKCTYKVGKQEVDGDCALRFARERKSYTTGDRHRGENQMQVISAIIDKMGTSKSYILNIPTILDIAADSFETSLTRDDIMAFIQMQLGSGMKWQVESISVDGTGSMQGTYSMGANRPLYVMIPNQDSVNNAKAKIAEYLA
ncbi:MAG: LCP family protein, partial [Candidatus Saccharibacteria bacterium]|nr:LCP family protein [Candidatus Saccharibacteria bacterium]